MRLHYKPNVCPQIDCNVYEKVVHLFISIYAIQAQWSNTKSKKRKHLGIGTQHHGFFVTSLLPDVRSIRPTGWLPGNGQERLTDCHYGQWCKAFRDCG